MEEKAYTYIVLCSADSSLYCGWTTDLDKRIEAHNNGTGAKYTQKRGPVKLIYSEEFDTRSKACQRECIIKEMSRKQKLKLIQSKYPDFIIDKCDLERHQRK